MSKNKVRLHAPPGTDEANSSFSPVPYKVDLNGDVEVDEEAVAPLLEKGGFTLSAPIPPVEVPHGHVQMLNPEDPAASCSFGGVSYSPDLDGVLTVPSEAAADLAAHGFISVETFTAVLAHAEPAADSTRAAPKADKPAEEAVVAPAATPEAGTPAA